MDTAVLKEPRGVMRMLQWFFSICAFATCCDFSTYLQYVVTCADGTSQTITHNASYPFK